jgi:hypothetical protein
MPWVAILFIDRLPISLQGGHDSPGSTETWKKPPDCPGGFPCPSYQVLFKSTMVLIEPGS